MPQDFFLNHLYISWKDINKWFFCPTSNHYTPYLCMNCYNNFLGLEYKVASQAYSFTLLYVPTDHKLNRHTTEDSNIERNSLPGGCSKTHTSQDSSTIFFFFFWEREKSNHSVIILLCSHFLHTSITSLTSTKSNVQSPYLQVHKFTIIDRFPVQQLIQRFTEYLLCGKHCGGPKN